jgi:steroid delta-isomerase-like uncharacterized protein
MVSRFISRLIGLVMMLAVIATPILARGTVAQDAATPCPAPTEEEAAAFATAYIAAWNAHDAAALTAFFSPDAALHWGIGVDTKGSDEIQASFAAFLSAFPGIHFTLDRVWLAGDTVVMRYITIGVQETDFHGIPASQTTVTWTGINVMQLSCGLITEQWAEADHFGRIQQQGAIPAASPEAETTPAG